MNKLSPAIQTVGEESKGQRAMVRDKFLSRGPAEH